MHTFCNLLENASNEKNSLMHQTIIHKCFSTSYIFQFAGFHIEDRAVEIEVRKDAISDCKFVGKDVINR